MDFNKVTQEAVKTVVAEKLPEMVTKYVSEMVQDIVKDTFRSYGDVSKQIKQKIEESINVNLQEFDLIDYNSLIAKTINENLLQQVNLQPILDMTQDIIGFVNEKTITLDEIADLFKIAAMEDSHEYSGEISFHVVYNEEHSRIEVNADIDSNQKESDCAVRFIFSTERGKIFSFKMKERYFDNKQSEVTPSKMVSLRGIEAKIFRLYSAQVQITDYDDSIGVEWYREDY
ncbi:hypothetical protein [Myroides odoratus]|uniref:Uncharacterized protein n=1 Tax=Myroides odoratus TaxID=256 RepID=A0A378RNU7_MYROD|nr:hypothetical protein [Myroides odoratus]QQU04206.1 hypothetical protein I6I89_02655 [Myroides odoratus]STZ28388.1 Uncharacterised protein [Myroides odoratus]